MIANSAEPEIHSRVLIVDDDRHNRETLVIMLSAEGYDISTAGSGEAALLEADRRRPDLILLDIMLPGMDGYQFAAQMKANPDTMNIPIIMVSALDDRDAKLLALSAGAEEFLTKPVLRAELCIRVRNLLRLKAYGDFYDRSTRRLEAEVDSRTADLVESESLYRSTFDAAPVGIVHVGLDGEWLRVNQRLCDLLGYTQEELRGDVIHHYVELDDLARDAESFRQMAAGTLDHSVIDEKCYRRRDASCLWAKVNTCVHRDAVGTFQYFISVIEDITEQRELKARERQASKMDAIGRLAAGVAHDFNNLLTVIIGFTELVATDRVTAARHGYELSEITTAAESAALLTKQLLTFSRQQLLNATPVDVNALITDMTGMLRRLIGVEIVINLSLAPELGLAFADRGQLAQVVMNLVVNARDAMPEGGNLTIGTSDVALEISAFGDDAIVGGKYVQVTISDTGTGISKDTQRHLFEPFFTTKETGKGTGLGLSMTYGIVKQSKGHIGVQSELGVGTTFTVHLPCADSHVMAEVVMH
ncbi:MAG: response regulator [bacterium]